ncbi:MAG: hypothetical protein ABIO44_03635 [Saprospiraceae bacterium]
MLKKITSFIVIFYCSTSCEPTSKLSKTYDRSICQDNTKEDLQKSVAYFSNIVKNDSNDLQGRYNLAMTYYKFVDSVHFQMSIKEWDYIISKDSCYNYAFHNRGICKIFLKNKLEACKDFENALRCQPSTNNTTRKEYKNLCK